MGIQGDHHPNKLMNSNTNKRKLDSPDPSPSPKIPRLDLSSPRRFLHHHHHHRSAAATAHLPADDQPELPQSEDQDGDAESESTARRILPLSITTIEPPHGGEEGTGLSVFTKGFFYVRGNDLRAGYWVYYRGHCVAKAVVWNDEFNEIRYEHQGYEPCMAAMNKSNVSPVTIGLMAVMDAIAWARNVLAFAHWRVYVDNVDALKLVDMYQRNSQFMKFHGERHLLDSILSLAQSGNIHLHRRGA